MNGRTCEIQKRKQRCLHCEPNGFLLYFKKGKKKKKLPIVSSSNIHVPKNQHLGNKNQILSFQQLRKKELCSWQSQIQTQFLEISYNLLNIVFYF